MKKKCFKNVDKWGKVGQNVYQMGEQPIHLQMNQEEQQYFVGEFRHKLDSKNRLTIPSDWRFGDGVSFLAIPDPNGSITVLPPDGIKRLLEAAKTPTLGDPRKSAALQRLASLALKVTCDKAGRINLDARLLAHAKIKSEEAVLVGGFTKFHIWNPKNYEAAYQSQDLNLADTFSALKDLGL